MDSVNLAEKELRDLKQLQEEKQRVSELKEEIERVKEEFLKRVSSYASRNSTENHFFCLIGRRYQIKQDSLLWADKISLKQFADIRFLEHEKLKRILNIVLASKFDEQEDMKEKIRNSLLVNLKWEWGQQLATLVGDVERGFPLYELQAGEFVQCDGKPNHSSFLKLFSEFWDTQFDPVLDIDWKFLDALFISRREHSLFHLVVSNYDAPVGGIVWKAQIEAFRRLLDSPSFDVQNVEAIPPTKPLPNKDKENLLKTIGLLAVALANTNSRRYTNAGGINVNAVKTDLLALIDDNTGLGERSIRERITSGIELIESYLKED